MPQNKKNEGDPRVESFAKIAGSPMLEHFSAQLSGEVAAMDGDFMTIKKGKDEVAIIIDKGRSLPVSKTTITEDGEKDTETVPFTEVKKGKYVKANATMLPSGDWELMGINIRENKRKAE